MRSKGARDSPYDVCAATDAAHEWKFVRDSNYGTVRQSVSSIGAADAVRSALYGPRINTQSITRMRITQSITAHEPTRNTEYYNAHSNADADSNALQIKLCTAAVTRIAGDEFAGNRGIRGVQGRGGNGPHPTKSTHERRLPGRFGVGLIHGTGRPTQNYMHRERVKIVSYTLPKASLNVLHIYLFQAR